MKLWLEVWFSLYTTTFFFYFLFSTVWVFINFGKGGGGGVKLTFCLLDSCLHITVIDEVYVTFLHHAQLFPFYIASFFFFFFFFSLSKKKNFFLSFFLFFFTTLLQDTSLVFFFFFFSFFNFRLYCTQLLCLNVYTNSYILYIHTYIHISRFTYLYSTIIYTHSKFYSFNMYSILLRQKNTLKRAYIIIGPRAGTSNIHEHAFTSKYIPRAVLPPPLDTSSVASGSP